MPAPDLIGNTAWQRQPGHDFGIEDSGRIFYNIVFAGASDTAKTFVASWPAGSACPEAGFTHLTLTTPPSPKDQDGARSVARLRFEGEDINGQFGQDEYHEHAYYEERDVELKASSYDKGVYAYLSGVVTYTYTSASKRSRDNTRFSPSIEDPEPLKLTSFTPSDPDSPQPINAEDLISEHGTTPIYKVTSYGHVTGAVRQKRGGAWSITESHTKRLEPVTADDD